jgi:hypothetical protein
MSTTLTAKDADFSDPGIQTLLFTETRQETKAWTFPEPLGGTVKTNGRTYNLVERTGNVAILRRTHFFYPMNIYEKQRTGRTNRP